MVFADKTTNPHEISPDQYNSLFKNSITKTYRKTEVIKTSIDRETRMLSKPLKLDNKMKCYAERHVFMTLKNHKEDFKQNTKCTLINLEKGEIGRVSKVYLEQIIKDVSNIPKLHQLRNISIVIKWSQIIIITGFYIMGTLVVKGLIKESQIYPVMKALRIMQR